MIRAFINRLFGRSTWVPPLGNGKEADDWRAGDLAVMIAKGQWHCLEDGGDCDGPAFGQVVRVRAVKMELGWHVLAIEGWDHWWTAECFNKLRPDQREACSKDFVRLIKRLRPKVDA